MGRLKVFLCLVGFLGFVISAHAGEIDNLLNKLVEKGILTEGEARQISIETKEEVKKEVAAGKSEAIPGWVQAIKLKGDFRARYEWDKDEGLHDYSRARIRARLGLEAKVNSKVTVGVGIATGTTSDPRSRNITLGNSSTANTPGSGKDLVLDYAYARYAPFSWAAISVGKFQNPIWQPHDVFWKGDITPEGLAVSLNRDFNTHFGMFFNEMVFALKNDSRTDKRPFMNAAQLGATVNFTDKLSLKSAFTDYDFVDVQNQPKFSYTKSGSSPYVSAGNTIVGGKYKYRYNTFQGTSELGLKEPLGGLVPYASLFGDYMYNPNPVHGNGGYDAGFKFGAEKVSDWAQWQQKFVYSKLGRDCWLDIFTDSDRYGGTTNSQAWEAIFEYGLGKNTSIALDYYFAESLTPVLHKKNVPERVLQCDFNFKF